MVGGPLLDIASGVEVDSNAMGVREGRPEGPDESGHQLAFALAAAGFKQPNARCAQWDLADLLHGNPPVFRLWDPEARMQGNAAPPARTRHPPAGCSSAGTYKYSLATT